MAGGSWQKAGRRWQKMAEAEYGRKLAEDSRERYGAVTDAGNEKVYSIINRRQ
jgi:hypothetical protein